MSKTSKYSSEVSDKDLQSASDQAMFALMEKWKKRADFTQVNDPRFLALIGAAFKIGFDEGFEFATGRKVPS